MSSQMQNIAKQSEQMQFASPNGSNWNTFEHIYKEHISSLTLRVHFGTTYALPFWEQYAQAHIIQRSVEIGPKLQL